MTKSWNSGHFFAVLTNKTQFFGGHFIKTRQPIKINTFVLFKQNSKHRVAKTKTVGGDLKWIGKGLEIILINEN